MGGRSTNFDFERPAANTRGTVHTEVFESQLERKHPAVLVLHGAGGTLVDGPEMRRFARHLAAEGNAVYLVRYFERTGTLFALDGAMQRHFRTWLETVRASAASNNPRVGAVVEQAGGVWNGRLEMIRKMPPVLMVHGEQDGRVPFEQYARPLVPVLRLHAATLETRFFPAEGHVFTPGATKEVREDAARFFRRYLRRPSAGSLLEEIGNEDRTKWPVPPSSFH